MNFYTRAVDKFVNKIGQHNMPFVYAALVLLIIGTFLFGSITFVKQQDMKLHPFEQNLQVLEEIQQDLHRIEENADTIGNSLRDIKLRNEEIAKELKDLERKAKELTK